MAMRNGLESGIMLQAKKDVQADFAWSCKNFAQSCEMLQKVVTTIVELLISHNQAKLVEFVRKGHFVVKL